MRMWAMSIQASAEAIDFSQSLASRLIATVHYMLRHLLAAAWLRISLNWDSG